MRKPNASNSTLSKALSALIVTCITMLLIVLIEKVARIMFGPWGSSGIMIFQADDELGFRLESNAFQRHSVSDLRRPFAANYMIHTNSLGCFDSEFRGEQPNILILGDSMTFGWVPFEDTWGFLIQQLTGIRTVKAAVPGSGPKYHLTRMRQLIPIVRPNVILVGYFVGNDPIEDYLWAASPEGPPMTAHRGHLLAEKELDLCTGQVTSVDLVSARQRADALLRRPGSPAEYLGDYMYRFYKALVIVRALGCLKARLLLSMGYDLYPKGVLNFYHMIYRLYAGEPTLDWVKTAVELNAQNLHQMAKVTREMGAELLVVLLPFPDFFQEQLDKYDPNETYTPAAQDAQRSPNNSTRCLSQRLPVQTLDRNRVIRRLTKSLSDKGVQYLDLFTGTEDNGLSYEGEFHLSPKGHKLIADRIAADPRFKEWCARLTGTRSH